MDHRLIARLRFHGIISDAQIATLVSCREDALRLAEEMDRLGRASKKVSRWHRALAEGLPNYTTTIGEFYTLDQIANLAIDSGLTPSEMQDLQLPDKAEIESVIGEFN